VAGLDIPSKLRRALGNGKVIPYEAVLAKLQPYDKDGDGALSQKELAEAFVGFGCGGPWFCSIMAKAIWQACESVIPPPVLWIKTTLVAVSVWQFMQLQPRQARRVRVTPEAAYGWEPLTYLDGTPVDPNQKSIPMLPDEKWDGVPAALAIPQKPSAAPPPTPAKTAAPPKGPLVQRPSQARDSPGVKAAQVAPGDRATPTAPPQPPVAGASAQTPARQTPPPRPGPPTAAGRPATAVPGRPAPVAGAAGPTAPARPPPARPTRPGPRR